MTDDLVYLPSNKIISQSNLKEEEFLSEYQLSIDNPDKFWAEKANACITWIKKWDRISYHDFTTGDIKWFEGGKLNVTVNCIDRHLEKRGDQTAIIWEGDHPNENLNISYFELHEKVCRFANAMKKRGVKKGDRVCIYMPMIPEAAYAMLACARIGAIHSVVFGGFSPESLKDRILDSDCRTVITADEGIRGAKIIPLKENVDIALSECPNVHTVFVVKRTNTITEWKESRDVDYNQITEESDPDCLPEPMDSEDPLFILYTSGSTGKPKGVMHTTAGYLLQSNLTFKIIFDYKEKEVFWCTADVGWITGHSYIIYGPLSNGATTLMFEGVPTYPSASRFWEVIDKHKVNIFYTAPTALRALMALGNEPVKTTSRKSLRVLGSVGEPINPEAWEWYYKVVGESKCPIVDTWWQTETGAIMISPIAGHTPLKPGSATRPFYGVMPRLLNDEGEEIEGEGSGSLVISSTWPSQIRSVFGDHKRCIETYYSLYPGYYTTGDGARRDKDGYYWITGRIDDVLNVSGHRLGTAEIESALVLHPKVAEAAVVGYDHKIKGQGIYCYVTLMNDEVPADNLKSELIKLVSTEIGSIAKPDILQWAPGLPKTRSGKIMRRILRKIAANELDNLGDTTTLAEPTVVEDLILNRENK
tara:strand:+ start:12067 stop:14004 length:1938 start_codon:yes stop_codon:yes gene_type:complete